MANTTEVVRDVTFNWANLVTAHSPFNTMVWDVQIVTENEETKAQLEALGVKMKERDGQFVANVKKKAINAKGEPNEPPKVLDADKNEMPTDMVKALGNGSKGHIKLFSYDWNMQGRTGKSALVSAIQVIDYVAYEGAGGNADF